MSTLASRRLAALFVLAGVVVACGEVDAPSVTPSTTSGTGSYDTDTGDTDIASTVQGFGTQVGSEGFWGCVVTDRTPHTRDSRVPNTDDTAAKAAADLAGGWLLSYDLADERVEDGGIFVDPPEQFTLVETDGSCEVYVEARVTAVLDRGDQSVAVDGFMALSASSYALRLGTDPLDDGAREAWGPPADASLTYLRVDAALDADGAMLEGAVAHASCFDIACDDEDELALFAGTR